MLNCGCQGEPRPSLEHNSSCPRRLGFFGAPPEWGVGKFGEKRISKGTVFEYTVMSWRPTFEDIKKIRKEKLLKLNEKKEKKEK